MPSCARACDNWENSCARGELGGEARVHRVGAVDPRAGQAEIGAESAGQPRQEERCADVREEADRGLRHGEHRVLAGDTVGAVDRYADAAAHADAVNQRDIGFWEGRRSAVERVFLGEERVDRRRDCRRAGRRSARMSPPAQNARSPAASITTAWMCGSSRHALQRADKPRIIGRSSALSALGRFRVIRPKRPSWRVRTLGSAVMRRWCPYGLSERRFCAVWVSRARGWLEQFSGRDSGSPAPPVIAPACHRPHLSSPPPPLSSPPPPLSLRGALATKQSPPTPGIASCRKAPRNEKWAQ